MNKRHNYPDCCIKYFENPQGELHDVNWAGFIPCMKHKDLSLEEITELLGRNPVTDDWIDEREPEPEVVHEEFYKDYFLDVSDSLDGTYSWYCYSTDKDGDMDDLIKSSSHGYFSKEEALEKVKEFADNYKGY